MVPRSGLPEADYTETKRMCNEISLNEQYTNTLHAIFADLAPAPADL